MDDPCYDIGGGAPSIGITVKDPTWVISRATSGVIPTFVVVSIKNARFKCQSSTSMHSFVSIRSTPFMEIDDKGEVGTKICKCIMGRSRSWTWTKREQHWSMKEDQNSWTREAHKEGEQAHELCFVAFDMCISMCLLALHKFLNLICILVCCMLVIELDWWFDN